MSAIDSPPAAPTGITDSPPAGYYPFKVGDLSCIAVSDGYLVGAVEMLACEISLDEVLGYLEQRGLKMERAGSQLSCLLIRDPKAGRTVLIDTGIGQAPGPTGAPIATAGKLIENLAAAGVDPEEIDTVLISHLHPDHVGGAFAPDGRPVFPNATFQIGSAEVDFWSGEAPDLSGIMAPPQFAQASIAVAKRFLGLVEPQAEQFAFGAEILPAITSVAVPGHSEGQSAFLIESGDDALFYTADAVGNSVISIERPEWRFFGDADSATAIATRKRLIGELRDERRRFFTPHFPWPNLGRIGTVGEQAVWMPEPYGWG
jgi:glyoxylase-like metal-dependent hydrolase (beta-lactamase superfamily II)